MIYTSGPAYTSAHNGAATAFDFSIRGNEKLKSGIVQWTYTLNDLSNIITLPLGISGEFVSWGWVKAGQIRYPFKFSMATTNYNPPSTIEKAFIEFDLRDLQISQQSISIAIEFFTNDLTEFGNAELTTEEL